MNDKKQSQVIRQFLIDEIERLIKALEKDISKKPSADTPQIYERLATAKELNYLLYLKSDFMGADFLSQKEQHDYYKEKIELLKEQFDNFIFNLLDLWLIDYANEKRNKHPLCVFNYLRGTHKEPQSKLKIVIDKNKDK